MTGSGDLFQFDYRRHVAALGLLPEHQEDFHRLVKLLSFGTGFQLLFARVTEPAYRDVLIAKLGDSLAAARPVHVADLAEGSVFPEFSDLERWLEAAGRDQAVIHLINGGEWLKGVRLDSLNLRRNALAQQVDATLIWWLPASALERVAIQAPDAWSWRGGVFDFVTENRGSSSVPLAADKVSEPINALTLAQRSQRLAVLKQQLKGEVPDDFRWRLLLEQADLLASIGQLREAEYLLREQVLPLVKRLGDERATGIVQFWIADILYRRGDLEEALRIWRDEQLPRYEKLRDESAKATTHGRIADILYDRGNADEALRVLREEVLPIFDKLGNLRSWAITQGKIADVLYQRGDLDDALRMRREEEIPVYEKLGDIRERAVAQGKIADILDQRGDLDEALRIRREDEMPVYEKLGDIRERAVAQGKIADSLYRRGDRDEALRILREEQLAILEKLGDMRGALVARANLAGMLIGRGLPADLNEARDLLTQSLADAQRLHLPEVEIIQGMLDRLAAPTTDAPAGLVGKAG